MKTVRYMITALAAYLPCRKATEAQPLPTFISLVENGAVLFARGFDEAVRSWDDGIRHHFRRVGVLRWAPKVGNA